MISVLHWGSSPDFLEDKSRPHPSKGKFWRMQRGEVSYFLTEGNIWDKVPSVHRAKPQCFQKPITASVPTHAAMCFTKEHSVQLNLSAHLAHHILRSKFLTSRQPPV